MPDAPPDPARLIELLTQCQFYLPRGSQLWHEIEAVRVRRDQQDTARLFPQQAAPNQNPFKTR
jgi:hypothetical protein